jgi:hypothetical protein
MSTILFSVVLVLLAGWTTAQYDATEALAALYYCKATYCTPANLPSWSCSVCVKHHPQFTAVTVLHGPQTGLLAITGYNPTSNQIVVAFRGSDNIKNWIADLNYSFTNFPDCSGCQVHEGFYEAWQEVESGILNSVSSLGASYPSASYLITGHSLGAAVALLAALKLGQTLSAPPSLYTFGEPRVGNPTFVNWAVTILQGGVQYRVTHASDPVPHVPPLDFGFLHVPHELWYDNNGDSSYSNCQDSASGEDPNCSDSTVPAAIWDHVMYLGHCTTCDRQPSPITGLCPL